MTAVRNETTTRQNASSFSIAVNDGCTYRRPCYHGLWMLSAFTLGQLRRGSGDPRRSTSTTASKRTSGPLVGEPPYPLYNYKPVCTRGRKTNNTVVVVALGNTRCRLFIFAIDRIQTYFSNNFLAYRLSNCDITVSRYHHASNQE